MKPKLFFSIMFGVFGIILYVINFFAKEPILLTFGLISTGTQLTLLLIYRIEEKREQKEIKERDSKIEYNDNPKILL